MRDDIAYVTSFLIDWALLTHRSQIDWGLCTLRCMKQICYLLIQNRQAAGIMPLLMCIMRAFPTTLQWRHNERGGISNHRHLDGLLNRLFRRRSKNISKFHVTGLCEANSLVTGEFSSQRASNVENVSIWWHHHEMGNMSGSGDILISYQNKYVCYIMPK